MAHIFKVVNGLLEYLNFDYGFCSWSIARCLQADVFGYRISFIYIYSCHHLLQLILVCLYSYTSFSFIDAEYSYQLYTRNERARIATCN